MSGIIYGINPVTELIKIRAPQIKKIIFAREKDTRGIKPLRDLAKQKHVPLEQGQRRMLNRISGTNHHQGVVAIVTSRKEVSLDEIIDTWQDSGDNLLALVLDGIQDPQNLGALIRTACASGVHGVITGKHRAAPVTGTVVKASAGAAANLACAIAAASAISISYSSSWSGRLSVK